MRARRLDLVLAIFYALFAIGWLLSDLPKALGVATPINRYYAQAIDPLFEHLPAALELVMKIAGLIYGPCYVAVVYGLARDRPWLPRLGVPLTVVMVGTTVAYLAIDLTSATPPANLPVFLALNGPYVVVPLGLLLRCVRRRP